MVVKGENDIDTAWRGVRFNDSVNSNQVVIAVTDGNILCEPFYYPELSTLDEEEKEACREVLAQFPKLISDPPLEDNQGK